jgi:FO synthase subunit 2
MFQRRPPPGLRRGATGAEVLKMYAVARLMLQNSIPNLQVSWVKEGPKLAQIALLAGANDFGGTLINESISTAAGASYGQLMKPSQFRDLIQEFGRIAAERSTTYRRLRVFEAGEEHRDLLDEVGDPAARFGSYRDLIQLKEFRFSEFYQTQKNGKA